MRRPTDVRPTRPRRGPPRGRGWLAAAVAAVFLLITSARGLARFYTDFLWFDELGITSVWRGVLGSKVMLSLGFTAVFFVVLLVNLVVADRLAPTFRPVGPEDEIVARYQEVVGP